jgi:DNA-binding GntR family transcriptional regulator
VCHRHRMPVDPYSEVPLYEQVASILRERITSGELEHLELLPSETQLAQELRVARDTVRSALAVLRGHAVIVSARHGLTGPGSGIGSEKFRRHP